jgi:antitoxin (DNA-binding transcriptional repressor) of toxin-antitoxin stability system
MEEITDLKTFTVEEFQADFDNLMNRVENGESFIIKDDKGSAIIVPFKETIRYALDTLEPDIDTEVIRIHTDHEEGS